MTLRRALIVIAMGCGLVIGVVMVLHEPPYDPLIGRWAVPELGEFVR